MSLPVNRARAPMHTCERKLETEWGREGHRETRREKGYGTGCIFSQRELAFPCRRNKEGGNGWRWVGE